MKEQINREKTYQSECSKTDYTVTLSCIECNTENDMSGMWATDNLIDNTNFVCHYCQYLYDCE